MTTSIKKRKIVGRKKVVIKSNKIVKPDFTSNSVLKSVYSDMSI